MIEFQVDVETPDGRMPTFITHPERESPHPVIILYMDARGIREELRDMARRFATVGYYCMLPDLYYRWGKNISFNPAPLQSIPSDNEKVWGYIKKTTHERVLADTEALLSYVERDSNASPGPKGCIGYCMGGTLILGVMGKLPSQFRAGSSLFGVGMVTDEPMSPHHHLNSSTGEIYFGLGDLDEYTPPKLVEMLRADLDRKKIRYEIEYSRDAKHGFVFTQRPPAYNKEAAERSWERTFSLFRRNLRA